MKVSYRKWQKNKGDLKVSGIYLVGSTMEQPLCSMLRHFSELSSWGLSHVKGCMVKVDMGANTHGWYGGKAKDFWHVRSSGSRFVKWQDSEKWSHFFCLNYKLIKIFIFWWDRNRKCHTREEAILSSEYKATWEHGNENDIVSAHCWVRILSFFD
jgi:hypothetical protein